MQRIEIEITRMPGGEDIPLPRRMSEGASGMDLHAAVRETVALGPGQVALIPTGFAISVPPGFEAQVRSRSGVALTSGVFVLNSPGTIDSDYRGELGVVLANFGRRPFSVSRGDRVAQLVVSPVCRVSWAEKPQLAATGRDSGGFGHTGGHGESSGA
ncbi:MAG: dUTP diphosphatase [Candidatus Eisenbacteria bacterium]|nr:dUTP diphosphatase [Candidatus Eisenbacteria bacterium]